MKQVAPATKLFSDYILGSALDNSGRPSVWEPKIPMPRPGLGRNQGGAQSQKGGRPPAREAERARREQARSVSPGGRSHARERIDAEVHREALRHHARQPLELAREERNQETRTMKSAVLEGHQLEIAFKQDGKIQDQMTNLL